MIGSGPLNSENITGLLEEVDRELQRPAAGASGCSSSGTSTPSRARSWRPPDSNHNTRQPSASPIP